MLLLLLLPVLQRECTPQLPHCYFPISLPHLTLSLQSSPTSPWGKGMQQRRKLQQSSLLVLQQLLLPLLPRRKLTALERPGLHLPLLLLPLPLLLLLLLLLLLQNPKGGEPDGGKRRHWCRPPRCSLHGRCLRRPRRV